MTLPQPPAPPMGDRCYRHPDREAGRRCTRCGRPACSQCLVQAAVGSHCLECAKAGTPKVATRLRWASARQPALITYTLIAVNVVVFAVISLQNPDSLARSRISRPEPNRLDQFDIGLREDLLADGEWWRMVTSGFLHFGLIHLLFNMLLLFQLGNLLEPVLGRVRFVLVYVAALLGGSAGAMLLQPEGFHGGASGAVFGLMGAAAIALRRRGINPFSTGIGTTLLLNLVLTFSIPGISIGGHLGGIVGGAVAAWFGLDPDRRRAASSMTYAAPVLVMIAAVATTWVVVR